MRTQVFEATLYTPRGFRARLLFLLAAVMAAAAPAHAAVAILLEQPYGEFGFINPTGHAAVYLDHVCADGPLKLRPCEPGEMGVVISRYDGIGGYDWIATPLIPYLYAVDSVEQIPSWVDSEDVVALRDAYRRTHLEDVAPDMPNGSAPDGNWYELAGSAYDRTIYGFSVKTTPEQDARLIALFNDRRNTEHYNGAFRNCADFVRVTINRYYPHAIRRNFIADLGMTTPKSVARGLAHYAAKHPELDLKVFMVPQVKGTLPRSHAAEGVAGSLVWRYALPLAILSPTTAAVTLAAYVEYGRFSMPKHAPLLALHDSPAEMETTLAAAPGQGNGGAAMRPASAEAGSSAGGNSGLGITFSLQTAGMSFAGH